MIPSFIGAIQLLIGLILLVVGSVPAMFMFVLLSGLMGGSAALYLPALGGSSIPPIQFALVFLAARILLPGAGLVPRVGEAFKANVPMVAFVIYGVVAAVLMPRLYRDAVELPPLRFSVLLTKYIYNTAPLRPTPQNITTPVYLVGTMLLAVCAYVCARHPRGAATLLRGGLIIVGVHIVLGVASVLTRNTGAEVVLILFRNANYAQLSDQFGGFVRINGIFPEASSYAAYAFIWFVFMLECWLRGVRPRSTGLAALLLAMVLVFSTSSSAYFSLAVYSLIVVGRMLFIPQSVRLSRVAGLVAFGLAGAVAGMAAMVLSPAFAHQFTEMFLHMTVEKGDSYSGLQRGFWARKALEAFVVSHGLGLGVGSFRSSSLLAAILGSTGVFGMAMFLLYLGRVLKPMRASTYVTTGDVRLDIGAAAGWAAVAALIPASIASPTPDPGSDFAIMAGAALGLRALAEPIVRRRRKPRGEREISMTSLTDLPLKPNLGGNNQPLPF